MGVTNHLLSGMILQVTHTIHGTNGKLNLPASSIRDLLIPQLEVTNKPRKGHGYGFKWGRFEEPGTFGSFFMVKYTSHMDGMGNELGPQKSKPKK